MTSEEKSNGNGHVEEAENGHVREAENGHVNDGDSDSSDNSFDSVENYIPTPPDGGWGWVIVFASLMCNIIVDGIGYSFGIFLPEFVEYFGESRSKVSLIGSLLCGTYLCAGPLVSGMTNKFGCRAVAMTGGLISTVAFLLAMFSPNIEVLIITYGVLGGFGFGMIYLPSIVSVGYYFERKRAVATGIAVCGSGIGTFIFAPLTKFLLDEYDWKNALFIIAGIVFNACVFGAMMRPLEPTRKKKKRKKSTEKPREKNVIDRIKENAKIKRRKKYTSESSGIGATDTTDILERVRQAKLQREQCLQENESEICSLPSQYFEKDKPDQRQDSTRSRLQKLSFSDNTSTKTDTPVSTPKVVIDGGSPARDSVNDNQSEPASSAPSSPVHIDIRGESPLKKRVSTTSEGSQGKTSSLVLPNGVHAHEVQPLIRVGNGGVQESKRNAAKELLARSGAAGASGSRPLLGASMRSISSKDYSRPMYKKDIFYSGSVLNITEFKSQPDMNTYITSITSIPGDLGPPESKCYTICSCLPKPIVDVLSEMLDVSLLTNAGFMCICLGNIFAMIGFYVPYVFIVDRAMLAGIDKTQASFLLSVIGITNTVGRILSGVLADLKSVNSLMLNNVCMLIAGVSIMLAPFCESYAMLVIFSSVFGLTTAAYISLTSIIICDLLGLEKLTNAFGLLTLARGVSSTLGPPIAGEMFQRTGNYDASFYLGGALFLAGTMLHFVLFLPCMRGNNDEELIIEANGGEQEMKYIKASKDGALPAEV